MKKTLLLSFLICSFLTTLIASESKSTTKLTSKIMVKSTVDTRPKYRIGFDAPQINHRQLLLTIDENATDGVDWGYDGEIPQVLPDDMYWIINDVKYVIQATNTLEVNKEIALGVITTKGGDITIKIDALENPIEGLKVALKDKELDIIHNLEESDYTVTLAAGEYHNRFSLVFLSNVAEENETPPTLPEDTTEDNNVSPPPPPGETTNEEGTDEPTEVVEDEEETDSESETEEEEENDDRHQHHNFNHFNKQKLVIYVANGQSTLTIKNKDLLKIQRVAVFNKYGQQIMNWTKNLDAAQLSLPLQVKKGFYFVVVQTQKGPVFKRVMVQQV